MSFILHTQLEKDTIPLGDLELCRVALMNNRHFPWLVLVPMREGLREIFELTQEEYKTAMQEIHDTAQKFSKLTGAYKMNVAAMGNMVPQLHIHIIARFTHDAAWPNPVWNSGVSPEKYGKSEQDDFTKKIRANLKLPNITKM